MAEILSQTPVLFFPFSRKGDLTDANEGVTLDFDRTSEATYIDAGRTLRTAVANEARFDHDPVTGQPLGLLIEEARTNICLKSGAIDPVEAEWSVVENADSTAIANPDGSMTFTKGPSTGRAYIQQSVPVAAGQTYAFFVDVVNNDGGWNQGNIAVQDTSEQIIASGLGRQGVIYTAAITGATFIRIGIGTLSNESTAATGAKITLRFTQFELGAFPTSYIPTTTATVTRTVDICQTNDVSWLNPAGEHTLYAKFRRIAPSVNQGICSIRGDADNYLRIAGQSGEQLQVINRSVPSGVGNVSSTIIPVTGSYNNIAAGLENGNNDTAIDGVLFDGSDVLTLFDPAAIDNFVVGSLVPGSFMANSVIADIAYFDERLNNGTLEVLTLNGLPYGGSRNYLAVMRRKLDRPPTKRVYPKPKRGLFR